MTEKNIESIKPHMLKGVLEWAENSGLTPSLITSGRSVMALLPESIDNDKPKSFLLDRKGIIGFDVTGYGISFLANIKDAGLSQIFIPVEMWAGIKIKETGQFFNLSFAEKTINNQVKWPDGVMTVKEPDKIRPKLTIVKNN